ncbi:MAG: hypothetical protein ACM3PT_11955 [Deltaproteobacteria bacterium]
MKAKKSYLLTLLSIIFMSFSLFAQKADVKIGIVKNNSVLITNPDPIIKYFDKHLENSGILDTWVIQVSSDNRTAFLYSKVRENKNNTGVIGITLIISKGKAYISSLNSKLLPSGSVGSVIYQCQSKKCNSCSFEIDSLAPVSISCKCSEHDPDCKGNECICSSVISSVPYKAE